MLILMFGAKAYIESLKANKNKLSITCEKIISYDPNEELMTAHNKAYNKMSKQRDRDVRDATLDYSMTAEGGILVKEEKGEGFKITVEKQKELNKKIDAINDKFDLLVEDFLKQSVDLYICHPSEIPTDLSSNISTALSLIINSETKK